jgi:hypothetical protein
MKFGKLSIGVLAAGFMIGSMPMSNALASHGSDDGKSGQKEVEKHSSSGSKNSPKSSKKNKKTTVLLLAGKIGDDDVGTEIKVKYQESTKNGVTIRTFEVEVEGAEAGQTFDVVVNGVVFTTITANAGGEVEAEFKSKPSDSNDQQLPKDFPVLHAGDSVLVGGTAVTLAKR